MPVLKSLEGCRAFHPQNSRRKTCLSFGLKTAMKLRIAADQGSITRSRDGKVRAFAAVCRMPFWLLKPIPAWAETIGAQSFIVSGGSPDSRSRAEASCWPRAGLRLPFPSPGLHRHRHMIAAAGAMLPVVEEPGGMRIRGWR